MIRHKIAGIGIFFLIAAYPLLSHAAPLQRALGGRVISGPAQLSATITCAATYGPFLLQPFGIGLPGPYFIQNALRGIPRTSGYFLGLYTPNTGTCYNAETGVPVPAYNIDIYGVSK